MIWWEPEHPLDFAACLARYRRWGPDPVNVLVEGAYHRVIRGPDGPFPYRARNLFDGRIAVEATEPALEQLALADLRHRLGELLPVEPLRRLAAAEPVVAALTGRFPGYRPPMEPDPFEALVMAICAQQVNLTWATTTRRRLVERFGTSLEFGGVSVPSFPNPADLAGVDPGEIRALQFSTRKSEYIVGLAAAAADGALEGLESLDNQAVIERVTALRGVGRWSAEWLLARTLARPDVVAAGDLGVRKAVSTHYVGTAEVLSEEEVRRIAARWGTAANWTAHLLLEQLAAA